MLARLSKGLAPKSGKAALKFRFEVCVDRLESLPAAVKKCRVVWSRGTKLQMTELADVRGGEERVAQRRALRAAVHCTQPGCRMHCNCRRCAAPLLVGVLHSRCTAVAFSKKLPARAARAAVSANCRLYSNARSHGCMFDPQASRALARRCSWWRRCTRTPCTDSSRK